MSGLDTARLLLASVPTAREVGYHEWTASKPECRGELRAAGEVLWFTYAGYEAPPVRELPSEPGALLLAFKAGTRTSARGIPFRLAGDGRSWHPLDEQHFAAYPQFIGTDFGDDWAPAVVVRDDEHGPAAAFRRILDAVQRDDIGCMGKLQGVEFAAREALKALGGEG